MISHDPPIKSPCTSLNSPSLRSWRQIRTSRCSVATQVSSPSEEQRGENQLVSPVQWPSFLRILRSYVDDFLNMIHIFFHSLRIYFDYYLHILTKTESGQFGSIPFLEVRLQQITLESLEDGLPQINQYEMSIGTSSQANWMQMPLDMYICIYIDLYIYI